MCAARRARLRAVHTLAFLDPGHFHATLTLREPKPARLAGSVRVRALRLPGRAFADHLSDAGFGRTARLDLLGRPVRGDRAAGPRRPARHLRTERPLAADRERAAFTKRLAAFLGV